MDIARTVIDQTLPRMRLDAGTFGTMVCKQIGVTSVGN